MRLDSDQRLIARALSVLWVLCIAAGSYWAAVYAGTPTLAGTQPATWPGDGVMRLALDRPTILVALHPRCSCSQATLEELERALTKANTAARLEVLLYHPVDTAAGWAESRLAQRARRLPGVHVTLDAGGREAERLGMMSSGHVALYGPDGRLRFSGGVTGARGHVGDNAGETALVMALRSESHVASRSSVFGCMIRELRRTADSP